MTTVKLWDVSTITKATLIEELMEVTSLSTLKAKSAFDMFFKLLIRDIILGKSLRIYKIGWLTTANKTERPVRNPKTGDKYTLAARRVFVLKTLNTRIPVHNKIHRTDMEKYALDNMLVDTKEESQALYQVFVRAINKVKSGLARIEIRGFGAFYSVKKSARIGRNPLSGKAVSVPTAIKMNFKPSRNVTRILNPDI